MVPDGAKAVVDLDGTREDRAMPSHTATTMPLVDMVLAVVWEDGHRRAEVGLRELRRGPRATLAGLVTPEDGAREEDGQARPDGAPEAPTRAGLERLTALELLEVMVVTPADGRLEATEETVDGLPEVPVDGSGKTAQLTTSTIIL